ncbi:MAG: DHH family phosphoesterase, partial [Thioalkalispiraceae bacterium]
MPRILTREIEVIDRLPDDIHPVLRRVYLSRGISESKDTENSLKRLLSFEKLKGISTAAMLLAEHVFSDNKILIIGDYDADGATSCALALRLLTAMGAGNVNYLVPNRFEYGYGLTPEIVAVALQQQPNLIITVDNGIASIDGVKAAKLSGVDVIVTDHHLPGEQLPEADAIVNPNQPGDKFESKNLAG